MTQEESAAADQGASLLAALSNTSGMGPRV
jgi:hypothetical protein